MRIWTGTASQAQTIAQELERISGYDIDSSNHINTVYGLTGNTGYDQEQVCPDCAGGYVSTDHGLVECDTCGGDGFYHWDTVPYISTHECMIYLSSWINYLSATQTDWSASAVPVSYVSYFASSFAHTGTSPYALNTYGTATSATYDGDTLSVGTSTRRYSPHVNNSNYVSGFTLYVSPYVAKLANRYREDGYDVFFVKGLGNNLSIVRGHNVTWSRVKDGSASVIKYSGTDFAYETWDSQPYYDSGGFFAFFPTSSGEGSNYRTGTYASPVSFSYATDVLRGEVSVPSGDESEYGVDDDWYVDNGDTSGGSTTVTNQGDTVYNTENSTYVTNNNLDVSAITSRLDVLNAIDAQIGSDLRTLESIIVDELNDNEWWLQRIYYNAATMNNTLEAIRQDMANLDRSTDDLVDLTSLESGVSALSGDIGELLAALTGSHGADALGVYGRLDNMLNWMDDYAPVDLSNIESILENWPDYPVFDASGILGAITGSHGSDLLGLYGRFDNLLAWVDEYQFPDFSGIAADVAAILRDWDNFMLVLEDWPDYPVTNLANVETYLSRLLGYSTVLAGDVSYSFSDLLYNIWLDLGNFCNDFVSFWNGILAKLDAVIYEIQALPHDGSNPWPTEPVEPSGDPIIGPIETDPYGYPVMPDWDDYREPLQIPALEHAIDELMRKFPFSMLNQLVQVATFIKRPPVAPQFDIPAPNPSDWSQPYLVHVDLSEFDNVAATLRLGLCVWAMVRISNKTIKMWMGDKAVE